MKWLGMATVALLSSACASMPKQELAWQALHAVDVAQTYSIAGDDCYVETDSITTHLIGENPSKGEVLAWGVVYSVMHYAVTEWLERRDAPRWIQATWSATTIYATSHTVYENHRIGLRAYGDNEPSRKFEERHCPARG